MPNPVNTLQNTASPWTAAIAPAVQGGIGIIGSGLNYYFNKKLAEQQNEFNLQMWNLQNEYNSPAAQMKRLEEAGLNTALMYGQGSTGNAAHAPEMVTPQAPRIDRDLVELSKAFNIEGLRKVVAERKSAEAKARIDTTAAEEVEAEKAATEGLGNAYGYDPATGTFFSIDDENKRLVNYDHKLGFAAGKLMQMLANNFRTNSLLMPRSLLIDSTRRLNSSRINWLAPQIGMRRYEESMYPYGYWIDKGTKALNALPLPKLNVKFNY